MEDVEMPRYKVSLTEEERQELGMVIQKGGKGYRIRHAQILLKLDKTPENSEWTYDRIQSAYRATHSTIAGIAKRFVFEGMEAALGRKKHDNYHRKATGEVVNISLRESHPHGGNKPLSRKKRATATA